MRRKDKAVPDEAVINAVLTKAGNGRLGLADGDQPYVVPVCFGYDPARQTAYVHCAREGRKLEIIARNPKVCLEATTGTELIVPSDAGKACGFSMAYTSVIAEGVAELMTEPEDVREALNWIMTAFVPGEDFAFEDKALARTAALRLRFDSISCKRSG